MAPEGANADDTEWTQELCCLGGERGQVEIKEVMNWFGKTSSRGPDSPRQDPDETVAEEDPILVTTDLIPPAPFADGEPSTLTHSPRTVC